MITITAKEIDAYGKTCETLKILEGIKNSLRPSLLQYLVVHGALPVGKKYEVRPVQTTIREVDWRGEAQKLAAELYGKAGALEWEQKTIDHAPTTITYRLTPGRRGIGRGAA